MLLLSYLEKGFEMRFHVNDVVRHTFLDQVGRVLGTWTSPDGHDMVTVLVGFCRWVWLASDCQMVSQNSNPDDDNYWF